MCCGSDTASVAIYFRGKNWTNTKIVCGKIQQHQNAYNRTAYVFFFIIIIKLIKLWFGYTYTYTYRLQPITTDLWIPPFKLLKILGSTDATPLIISAIAKEFGFVLSLCHGKKATTELLLQIRSFEHRFDTCNIFRIRSLTLSRQDSYDVYRYLSTSETSTLKTP